MMMKLITTVRQGLTPFALTLILALGCRAQQPSLEDFFQRLVQSNGSPLPTMEELMRVTDQIPSMPPDRVAAALSPVSSALRSPNDDVKLYASTALFAVSRRPDSGRLLGPYVKSIAVLFDQQDARLQGTPSLIFVNLKPQPPPEVISPLVSYLRRTDRDAKAQASAVYALTGIAPEKPEVVEAIREFLARPLDNRTRIGAMNALGNPRVKDANLIASVISSLDDPDQGVRFAAVQTLRRIGRQALLQGQEALWKVVENANEAAEVRSAAEQALKTIRPQ